MGTDTTRRALLGGAGLASVALVAAVPFATACVRGPRHAEWLAERNRLMTHANAVDCRSRAFDAACSAMNVLEDKIISTPVASAAEARAKLRFVAVLHAEGSMLGADDASDLIAEVAPFLATEA